MIERTPIPSTSAIGREYERCAMAFCRRKGYQVVARNLRLKGGEIDCLALDARNRVLILIEVRGRANGMRRPSEFLSHKKIEGLKRMAQTLALREKRSVRIFLLEVIGKLPRAKLCWGLEYFPERLGLSLRDYEID